MLHQIGVGALGPVFRTYEPTRDRLVAVKVFRLDVTPEQARALADELAKAADAGLFHPSIVEPVAAGIEGTVAYRAEEYVAAESLDVAMRHYAPATVDKVLPFITQLASALDFARAAGVGHGALHPRDIFVTPDEARATGFGVVDALDRLGLRAPVRRPYSPPERIAGEAWSTPADVFSLGVIAFELLTGRRPSGLGDDMGPLTGATLGDRADEIRAVLARAMHVSPPARYASAREFSAALAEAAGVAETAISLVDRSLGRPAAPSADLEPQIAPAEPLAPPVDLPLAAAVSAADPVRDAAIDDSAQALDDFGAEPELPSPTDSPREAVRKVIAAREARKRQVRKKAVDDVATDAAVAATAQEAEAVPVAQGLPVAGVLFDTSRVDVQAATPPGELESVEHEALEPKSAVIKPGEIRPAEIRAEELKNEMLTEATLERASLELERASLEEVALEETPIVDASTRSGALGEVVEVPLDFVAAARDLQDRVVTVDEFRARDAVNPKPDRSWPRVAEPSLLDRPERVVTARSSAAVAGPASGSGLGLGLSSPSTSDSIVADVPPSAFEETAPARQRLEMLPMALLVGLGLVLGYPLGYVVGHRDKAATVADATAAPQPAEGRPATAATGTAGANETTVSVPSPAKPTDTSNERAPAATPSPSSTRGVKAPAAAPAPRAAKSVPTAGRLVVTSNPAKAAVTINGKWSGRTPLTVGDLKFGKYVVRVVQKGFVVSREEFTLSESAASRTVDVTLRPLPADKRAPVPEARTAQPPVPVTPSKPPVAATGAIFVDSRPRGARVFIDGKEVGVTPLTVAAQPTGSHAVRLELADHQAVTETTQVVAQKTAHVTLSLERIR